MIKRKKEVYTFIDLFAGCGGLSEGFYKQGFKALAHLERDHHACESLRTRMRHYKYANDDKGVLEMDITQDNVVSELKKLVNDTDVDLIIGGPPCQSFSTLGRAKDKNAMVNDPRNHLFESYVKILNKFNPKFFVFENVTGLLSAKINGKLIVKTIFNKLGEKYKVKYDPKILVLNSADYGVPQIRKRVIIIGVRKDISISPEEIYQGIIKTHFDPLANIENKTGLTKYVTVKDAIGDLPEIKPGEGIEVCDFQSSETNDFIKKIRNNNDLKLMHHVSRKHNQSDIERYKLMSKNKWSFADLLDKRPDLNHSKQRVFNNSYVVQWWNAPSKTIIAHLYKDGNQFIHPDHKQGRSITPREAARLQSFPDDFVFEGPRTEQFKQIGNAVPPLFAEAIAKSIRNVLDKI